MKWNITNVAGASLLVGIAGFGLGKLTGGSNNLSEEDKLLLETNRLIEKGDTTGGNNQSTSAGNRPSRSSSRKSSTENFDEKLIRMEEIVRGENALTRGRAMLDWIDSLAPEEFRDAVDRFRGLGLTEARMGEYAMLLTAWAEVDPAGALAYTTENTSGGMATNTVLSAWASRDPEAAIAWAKSKHDGEGANPYMAGIIRGLAETNISRATQVLAELPFSSERGEALDAMIPHLLRSGSDAAKQWANALTDERLRNGAIARLSQGMAKDNPSDAVKWLLANNNETTVRSFDEVYQEWFKKDKEGAMATLGDLPEGAARSRALRGLVTMEAREDPAAAANLMKRYPEDVDDRMVLHFVWNAFDKSPDVALSQVGLIQDEERRNRMYSRGLESWLQTDQAAAKKWIASAKLPQQVLDSLQTPQNP